MRRRRFGNRLAPVKWAAALALSCVGHVVAAAQAPAQQQVEALQSDNKRFEDVVGARAADNPGGKLFETYCAECHVRGAAPNAPHRDMLQLMSPESIVAALNHGSMKQQAAALDPQSRQLIAEFLANRALGSDSQTAAAPRCSGKALEFDYREPPAWNSWGIARDNGHLVPTELAGIDRANVRRLKLKWAFAFPDATRVRSQPMPAGGALYVGSHNGEVFALDRSSGCIRWSFRAGSEVRTGIVISPWKPGDTRARPIAYFGDFLGSIYAVDAVNGKSLWRVRPEPHPSATITAAPALYDGKLYVSFSSLEVISAADPKFVCCTFRGSLRALDAATGRELWKTYTIAEIPQTKDKNRVGTDIIAPSGAPIWNTVAIDEQRRQLYFGTGENYSSPSTGTSDAMFAVSMDSGAVKWVYQATSGDAFNAGCLVADQINCPKENGPDVDFGAAVIYDTKSRPGGLVMGGQKNGVVHALDPATGKLVWKTRVGRGGVVGGVHFGMAAGNGRLYVPLTDTPDNKQYPDPPRPGLFALDVATGKEVWAAPMENRCGARPLCYPGISQAITATPDLVFAGGIDGVLRVYDASSGRVAWEADTNNTVTALGGMRANGGGMGGGAAPVPYRGMLFVSSGYAFAGLAAGNVLLAYEVQRATPN